MNTRIRVQGSPGTDSASFLYGDSGSRSYFVSAVLSMLGFLRRANLHFSDRDGVFESVQKEGDTVI
eukprot:1050038-Rhodomonas_salina.1